DADRDRQGLAFLIGPLREQSHIVGGDDIDAGETLFLDDEPIDAAVESKLGVARDHHAGRDHRSAVVDRGHRNRQFVEIDILTGENHFARRRGLDVFRRNRLNDGLRELVLDLAIAVAAERDHCALARTDEAGDDGHLVPNHLVEEERGLGLVDEGCDVADVDGLMQIHELAVLAQPVQELAKVLLHHALRTARVSGCWRPSRKLPRPAWSDNPLGSTIRKLVARMSVAISGQCSPRRIPHVAALMRATVIGTYPGERRQDDESSCPAQARRARIARSSPRIYRYTRATR